jgi:uncharacterized protein DUF4386
MIMSTTAMTEDAAEMSPRIGSGTSTGRILGVLMLVHLVGGLFVPFVLLDRVRGSAGFLAGAAGSPVQLRAAVLLLFAGSALAIGIAITAWPVIRRYSSAMALWLVALAVAAFALQAVDNAALLSLLSLSQEYVKADAAKLDLFQMFGVVLSLARKWVHYTALFLAVSWIFLLFSVLYRLRLVPRVLAGLGLVASMLQIIGVTLRGFLGYPPEMRMAMPLAPAYVALAVWLMVKGLPTPKVAEQ